MKLRIPVLLAAIFSVLSLPSEAEAQSWKDTVDRKGPGGHANLRPCRLEYTLAWNGKVNAGKFEVSIVRAGSENEFLVGDATGKSTGFARVLWPYDFKARSIVEEDSLRPVTFQLRDRDRKEENHYDIIFEPKRQIFTTTTKPKNKDPITRSGRFKFDWGHDVLSSAFYLRSQPLAPGDTLSMVVTPFNSPYLTKLRVAQKETRKIRGKTYNTIRLDANVAKINPDQSLKTYEKIKRTSLWVTDDEYRIPLELQADISVGFVTARLNDLDWLE